jgi:hypothetical protein
LAIEEATSIEIADIMLVVKKSDPNFPSCRLNFHLKKYVTHELYPVSAFKVSRGTMRLKTYSGARPDAKASNANRMHRLSTIILLSGLMEGSSDRLGFDFLGLAPLPPKRGVVSESRSGAAFFSASQFLLREMAKQNLMSPITA